MDENVDEDAAVGLRARGFDVTTTSEQGMKSVPDEDQLAFALRSGRVLVSHDPDMLRLAGSGREHAGIAFCSMEKYTAKYKLGGLVRRLLGLAASVDPATMRNRIEYL